MGDVFVEEGENKKLKEKEKGKVEKGKKEKKIKEREREKKGKERGRKGNRRVLPQLVSIPMVGTHWTKK